MLRNVRRFTSESQDQHLTHINTVNKLMCRLVQTPLDSGTTATGLPDSNPTRITLQAHRKTNKSIVPLEVGQRSSGPCLSGRSSMYSTGRKNIHVALIACLHYQDYMRAICHTRNVILATTIIDSDDKNPRYCEVLAYLLTSLQ